ncbi:transposase [Streptomyces sp. NPDC057433]|uniref:transposase n=1 Tax=Streptomyces sp. NPDC057433 TaxID=3346132 RepID=UPI003684F4B1
MGSLHRRRRAVDFKKFLTRLDKEVPTGLDVPLALGTCATHKTPAIKQWLPAHPRFQMHFAPTGASWPNLVERWFAELTQKKLKRDVHRCVQPLERDIRAWLADRNEHPGPFFWTNTTDEILDKVAAHCRRISDSGHWTGRRARSRRTGPGCSS